MNKVIASNDLAVKAADVKNGPQIDLVSLQSLLAQIEDVLGLSRPPASSATIQKPASPAVARSGERLVLPTDWPRIGGRDWQAHAADTFDTPAFKAAWRPGGRQIAIYVAACTGLSALARMIHMPVFKVSTCGVDRVWPRMRELRRDAYGSVHHSERLYSRDDGWSNWFPSHLNLYRPPAANSPVACGKRSFIVNLPEGMSPEDFECAFDAEVRKGAIDLWSMSQMGRDHCATIGLDPSILRRFTEYPGGSDVRRSPAKELVAVNPLLPGSGADRILAIAEGVILRHLRVHADYGQLVV